MVFDHLTFPINEPPTTHHDMLLTAYAPGDIFSMTWEVEYTNEFGEWWTTLDEDRQDSVDVAVKLLEVRGPRLPFPFSSGIVGSRHGNLRELRIQHRGEPLRVFYAFDPRRAAILLIGGSKQGDGRFYERMIPVADKLFDDHLEGLRLEADERD